MPRILFVILLACALLAGLFLPETSQWLAAYRHIFLFSVMFLVGLEQRPRHLIRESKKWPLVLLSLSLNYFYFSFLAWVTGWVFFRGEEMLMGFAVLGAVPVTLTSAVIYTRLDRGNARLALLIVFVGQFLSLLITPALLALFVRLGFGDGSAMTITMGQMMRQLLIYFLLPLCFGMFVRYLLPLKRLIPYLVYPEQLTIALFVFIGAGQIPVEEYSHTPLLIGKVILAVLLFQMLLSLSVRGLVRRLPPDDQTPLFFTATQKTLTAGLYIALNYFPATAILPLFFYHLAQLTLGRLYWVPPSRVSSS